MRPNFAEAHGEGSSIIKAKLRNGQVVFDPSPLVV
jgi:hypothetical protein